MADRAQLRHHAGLLDRMATANGVDLEQSIIDGRASVDDLTDAVLSCTRCSDPAHCSDWLARQTQPVAAPPSYCRNADLMARLRV